ncbi:MAG: hypothetical protein O7D86_12370 [Proteobacteria bacterium]|nr:hypothetical protein [Pseudomonadota bacterium]
MKTSLLIAYRDVGSTPPGTTGGSAVVGRIPLTARGDMDHTHGCVSVTIGGKPLVTIKERQRKIGKGGVLR